MSNRIARGLGLIVGVVAAVLGSALPSTRAADDDHRPRLKLVLQETVAEAAADRWTAVAAGAIAERNKDDTRSADYTWTAPPAEIDEDGFTMTLRTEARAGDKPFSGGARVTGTDFKFDPELPLAELELEAGQSDATTLDVHVAPRWGIGEGDIVDLNVGVQWGPSVHYRYRATYVAPEIASDDEDSLTAELDCPGSIAISRLPSLSCHINLAGWKRGTGDPVEIVLPDATDAFGNHINGIQISGAGSQDVSDMGEPYSWGLMIFACPGLQGPGANCAGHATVPGPTTTPIIVRQKGRKDVALLLDLDAEGEQVAGPDPKPEGPMAPVGQIEAKLDCPATISIAAMPGVSCNIVVTNWRHDTTDPVFVLLPGAVDSFGNHANGLQVKTEEEERVFGWEAPHLWGISIYACPADGGENCFNRAAKPGPATVDIILRQNGMTDAKLALTLDAIAPPPPTPPPVQ